MSSETTFVTILGKEYQVACPAEEQQALLRAAQDLDERMKVIKNSGNIIGLERIAVMAALNLSHELLSIKSKSDADANDNDVQRLISKLDQTLQQIP